MMLAQNLLNKGHSVPKQYTYGTHRACDPAETFRTISAHFPAVGLTRVADVTGLDTIGIPVCVAVRPNSKSLSVSQGKGLTLMQAKVSAAMESIETHHAENITQPVRMASYREISRTVAACDPRTLNLHPLSLYHEDLPLAWIKGFDLIRDCEVWIPFDLVHCSYLAEPKRQPTFTMSSNGLASGNHILEAISHGICEAIERDASFLWEMQNLNPEFDSGLVDLDRVDSVLCRQLLQKLGGAGVSVYVWDQTSELGIPSFACAIVERQSAKHLLPLGPHTGFGCHLSSEIALVRALTEAAQSRLTHISGARDDMFRKSYLIYKSDLHTVRLTTLASRNPPTVDFNGLSSLETESLEDDISTQVTRLAQAGFDQVIVVDLTHPDIGISVVRIIIPGMEFKGKFEGLPARLSQRARDRLLKQALTRELLKKLR